MNDTENIFEKRSPPLVSVWFDRFIRNKGIDIPGCDETFLIEQVCDRVDLVMQYRYLAGEGGNDRDQTIYGRIIKKIGARAFCFLFYSILIVLIRVISFLTF